MTSKIFDATAGSPFNGRKVLFDTNIWFCIEGYGSEPGNKNQKIYSGLYSDLRKSDNVVIVNDYVIGEFFNRSARLEYEVRRNAFKGPGKFPHFKALRKQRDFIECMETVRDTCLNIIEDCEYVPVNGADCDVAKVIEEATGGQLDLADIILREHCRQHGFAVVSHDADFADGTVDLITGNAKVLGRR